MSKREVKEMTFLKILKSICVCGKLNTVRLGIPGSWTSVTEATFTKFSLSAMLTVSADLRLGLWLDSVIDCTEWAKYCGARPVQCGFDASMYTTCIWFCVWQVTSVAASVLVSLDHEDQG